MTKKFEGNEDWVKRGEGRIPTKGAMAAERASAGLGTSDDDDGWLLEPASPPLDQWATPGKPAQRPK
jgi:hypothetical protein